MTWQQEKKTTLEKITAHTSVRRCGCVTPKIVQPEMHSIKEYMMEK